MSEKYPLPSYACSIWVAGDNLMVAFPGTVTEQGHTIKLPAIDAGMQTALKIMRDRSQSEDLRLSQRGTPTQYESEALLAAMGRSLAGGKELTVHKQRADAQERAEAAEFLKELGL